MMCEMSWVEENSSVLAESVVATATAKTYIPKQETMKVVVPNGRFG